MQPRQRAWPIPPRRSLSLSPNPRGGAVREKLQMDDAGFTADGAVLNIPLLHAIRRVQRNDDSFPARRTEINPFIQRTATFLFALRHVIILGARPGPQELPHA